MKYDLEDRTLSYAVKIAFFVKSLKKDIINIEYIKQVIRSSGSIGANYIEANEALSKKDFIMRIKICRKEAKETRYWLALIEKYNNLIGKIDWQIEEATQFVKIFSKMLENSK